MRAERLGRMGSAHGRIPIPPERALFLDIQMDLLNGIAFARALDAQTLPLIVFVTAFDNFALEAFGSLHHRLSS